MASRPLKYVFPCGSRGYHVYRNNWSPTENEELSATKERDNRHDKYAIALKPLTPRRSHAQLVGHLPHEISKDTWNFITNGGQVTCKVTSTRSRQAYGGKGPEIPIQVTVTMDQSEKNELIMEEYKLLVNEHYREPIGPNDAMKSLGVTVTMNITNIGTQGYPGIGKTSVLDLAIGKEPAPTRTSTDCVDPPSRYLMIDSATEGIEWENVTSRKMFELVCEAMKKTIEDNPPDIAIPTAASQSTCDEHINVTPVASDLERVHPLANSSNRSPVVSASPDPSLDLVPVLPFRSLDSDIPNPYASSSPDASYSDFTVFSELLEELSDSKSSGVIFNSHWMMVTDCGGQLPFLDAAALFLRNSCLQIFPVKLNEPLSKRPEFTYFYKDVCASFDEDCVPLTHKQIIETLAKSVSSIQPPYTPSATKCPNGAKFTIVGTFEDEAHKCSETVEEKESILKKVLEPYEPFRVQLGKKVILPINAAVKTKKERTESAKKLRKLIKKSDVSMKIDMKLHWFGFLLSIAENESEADVLTLEECYSFGDTLGMDKSETRKAIQFFHDISLIMHFDTPKLRDSVIINTKPVLKKLSRIISVSFLDEEFLSDHYKIFLPSGAKELLQQHGRFSRTTLEKSGIKFTEPVTVQFFLDILEHVKIVVAIDKESEYFMPCALSYAPEASMPQQSSLPWVIRLRVRRGVDKEYIPIPVGYLPAIVVFLLTEFSSLFSTYRRQRQYRNKIVLEYEHGGFISLVERHLQLEIHYSGLAKLPKECQTIRNHVLESIRLTEEKLHIIQGEGAITKVDSFLCSCDKCSADHFCTFKPSGCVECEKTRELYKLDPQHLLWLGNKSPTARLMSAGNIPESSHTSSASCQQEQAPMEDSARPIATIHQLSVTEQEQVTTETAYEDELPPTRKRHKHAPPEATSESEILQESSHTNSASGTTQQELSTTAKADANTILHKLQKHKFPEHKWMNLATGLMLGSRVPGIVSENSSDLSRLIALVNHWTANSDEGSRWKTLVDAVNDSGEYIVAKNLAQDVGVHCPPGTE